MDQGQTIIKNSFFVTGSQAFNKIISLISVPIIARLLGTEGFGAYTLAFSFVMLFGGISDFGIENLTIRDISRDKSQINKFLSNSLLIRFLITTIVYLIIIIVAKLLNYPDEIFYLISILGLIIFANFLINTFNAIIISLERMEISSIILSIQYLITPLTAVAMLYLGFDLKKVFLVMVYANTILALIYVTLINKFLIHLKWEIDLKFLKYIIKSALPFAILAIIWLLYIHNGVIILSKIKNIEAVGIYNAAFKLIMALLFISSSVILVFFPIIARQSVEKIKSNLKKNCESALRALFLISFPIAIGISIISKSLINLLYGNDFVNASPVLAILIWALLFIFISSPLGLIIINSVYLKQIVYVLIIHLLFSIILNVFFITRFSYVGGAISLLITEVLKFIILYLFIKRYLNYKLEVIRILKKPFALGVVAGSSIYLLKMFSLPTIGIIAFSTVFYLLLLTVTKEYIFITTIKKFFNFKKIIKSE